MQDKLKAEWTALVQEGVRGQATRFRLRAARLVQLLHKSDTELAQVLMDGLAGAPFLHNRLQAGVDRLHPDRGMRQLHHSFQLEQLW